MLFLCAFASHTFPGGQHRLQEFDFVAAKDFARSPFIGRRERHEFVWVIGENPAANFINEVGLDNDQGPGKFWRTNMAFLNAQADPPINYDQTSARDDTLIYQPYVTLDLVTGVVSAHSPTFDLTALAFRKGPPA